MYKVGDRYRHTAVRNSVYVIDMVDNSNSIVFLKEVSSLKSSTGISVSFSDMKRLYKKVM